MGTDKKRRESAHRGLCVEFPVQGKRYQLTADSRQWVIRRYSHDEDGVEQWRPLGFYATLDQGLIDLHQIILRTTPASTLEEACKNAETILAEIVAGLAPGFTITKHNETDDNET